MKILISAQVQYIYESNATTFDEAIQEARDALDFDMHSGGATVVSIQDEINLSTDEDDDQ